MALIGWARPVASNCHAGLMRRGTSLDSLASILFGLTVGRISVF